jgi:hypothetical protein
MRRLWGGHWARQLARLQGRLQRGRSWARPVSRTGSVQLLAYGGGVAAYRLGRWLGKQAVQQASVVGQAGSEQVDRAARSHNLLERHLDSIKERRLWSRLWLKVSSTASEEETVT